MKRKLRAYIAGPISKGDLCHNVNQATAAFVALAKAGCAPMCPHWSVYAKPAQKRRRVVYCTACIPVPMLPIGTCDSCEYLVEPMCVATVEGNPELTHADWLGICLAWVDVCDFVVRLPGESKGADMEVARAMERGIPVFHTLNSAILYAEAKGGAA